MKAQALILSLMALMAAAAAPAPAAAGVPAEWQAEFPDTDFSRHAVPYDQILAGGPSRDGIPAIDDPRFAEVGEVTVEADAPVIALEIAGDARAYPLGILTWHEIVNDTVGGVPVAVTFCPLCNAGIVFERRLPDGRVTTFGTTGKLRHSDLVMYDRATETWWQQFSGEAIVGALTGAELAMRPARLESFARFRERFPDGRVLVPIDPHARPYGQNPYLGYDSAEVPFLYRGPLPEGVPAMMRVAVVGDEAWTLGLLREEGRVRAGDLVLEWQPGQASALDAQDIARGRDVGNVVVRRVGDDGAREEVVHHVVFAFVFRAFQPDGTLHHR